jgi:hypothetical protein
MNYFLYALEIIENAQDYKILSTNLQPINLEDKLDALKASKTPLFVYGF